VRVLDGPLAPISCASRTRYEPCEDCDEATCQVRHMMLEVRHAIVDVLDNRSLAEMRDAANDDMQAAWQPLGGAPPVNSSQSVRPNRIQPALPVPPPRR
jgi:DNA-binding IscR family transcriptional regulator